MGESYAATEDCENIDGRIIKLKISKHSNATEVTLENDKNANTNKAKFTLLLLLAAVNALASLVNLNYLLVLLPCLMYVLYKFSNVVKYESLLLVKSLGCQINVARNSGNSTRFIPHHIIDGIFVNEVISRQQRVLYVLSIRIKQPKNCLLIPLFVATKPRLKCIETIYRNIEDFL